LSDLGFKRTMNKGHGEKELTRKCPPDLIQTHTHEFLGSTALAGVRLHNHRFAGVSSEEIPRGRSHVHAILTNTDFFVMHLHEVGVTTGLAIPVGEGKHVHLATGITTCNAAHAHEFIFATIIENPLVIPDDNC